MDFWTIIFSISHSKTNKKNLKLIHKLTPQYHLLPLPTRFIFPIHEFLISISHSINFSAYLLFCMSFRKFIFPEISAHPSEGQVLVEKQPFLMNIQHAFAIPTIYESWDSSTFKCAFCWSKNFIKWLLGSRYILKGELRFVNNADKSIISYAHEVLTLNYFSHMSCFCEGLALFMPHIVLWMRNFYFLFVWQIISSVKIVLHTMFCKIWVTGSLWYTVQYNGWKVLYGTNENCRRVYYVLDYCGKYIFEISGVSKVYRP